MEKNHVTGGFVRPIAFVTMVLILMGDGSFFRTSWFSGSYEEWVVQSGLTPEFPGWGSGRPSG